MRLRLALAAGLVALAVAALPAATAAAPAAAAEEWLYTVRPGDELWNVAARYCGSPSYAPRIAALNGLADQGLIRAGRRLRIPVAWLIRQPAVAEVVSVNGIAFLLVPQPRPARAGQVVEMGQRLRTDEGSVVIGFADGSTLQVSPDSEVLFNVLTAYGDTGMVDTNLRFYRGRSTSRIIRRHSGSRFRISTPSGTAAVRGTEFRVAVEDDGARTRKQSRTLTETLGGEVGFAQGSEISVPAGVGAVAAAGGVFTEPLLEAPAWQTPPGVLSAADTLAWNGVPGAEAYRVSVFRPEQPLNPVRQVITAQPRFALDVLEPASYLFAARGISRSGLEGYDALLAIEVRGAAPRTADVGPFTPHNVRLSWRATEGGGPYVVQISEDAQFNGSADRPTSGLELGAEDLRPGRYQWRVRDAVGVFSAPRSFEVRPSPVSGLRAQADALRLSLDWAPVEGAESYRVDVGEDDRFHRIVSSRQVREPRVSFDLERYGNHVVRVAAEENGLSGEPAVLDVRARPPTPWWPMPFALIFLLAL